MRRLPAQCGDLPWAATCMRSRTTVAAAPYKGRAAAFIRSMLNRLLTLRSGMAAISLR